jgi:SAM-dependent methyltransferase
VSFDRAWLDLREPADHAARDPGLLSAAADWLATVPDPVAVDLGCGTGSTVRAFGAYAPAGLRWRLVDRDTALLDEAARRCGAAAETFAADLGDLAALPFEGAHLVTASALFDLMPESWILALVDRLAAHGLGLYAALNFDGRMAWNPKLSGDTAVTTAFNRHQQSDKGLGPALGPAATPVLASALSARGYTVRTAYSPWRLGPGAAKLQAELVGGIAAAAAETGLADAIAWGQARRAASGSTSCTIGHADLLALPSVTSAQSNRTSVPSP